METGESFVVEAFQLQQKTLPGKLRKMGVICLCSEYVEHWPGPEPQGLKPVGASSLHFGMSMTDPGYTFWFFVPESSSEGDLPPELLDTAGRYIFERMGRRSHKPVGMFTSHVFVVAPPGTN